MNHHRSLLNPVIRPVTASDAHELASMVIQSNSVFLKSIFGNEMEKGYQVLYTQFTEYNEGIYVLEDREVLLGVMKLHLPNQLIGNTISYKKLIRLLGFWKGLRAGILFSHWDEYHLHPKEAYIEYLYVHRDWQGSDVQNLLIDHATQLAEKADATYLTRFVPKIDYNQRDALESIGFIFKRKIHSPLARLLKAEHTVWYKAILPLRAWPRTFRQYMVITVENVRDMINQKTREFAAALRLTVALAIFPVIAGGLAYTRGYTLAAGGWIIITTLHIVGLKLVFSGSRIGRWGIMIATISEGVNLLGRTLYAQSWAARSGLLPMALLAFWICFVVYRSPENNSAHVATT